MKILVTEIPKYCSECDFKTRVPDEYYNEYSLRPPRDSYKCNLVNYCCVAGDSEKDIDCPLLAVDEYLKIKEKTYAQV